MDELILIPTLTDSRADFEILFGIARQVHGLYEKDIVLDFSNCTSLMQNAVSVIGGLVKLAEHHGNQIELAWPTIRSEVARNLARNGLMEFLGKPALKVSKSAVPFRHDTALVEDDLVSYLYDSWIGKGRVHLSDALKGAIVGKACEIYINAFDHGHSPVGVFTSGEHYRQKKLLKLCVVDFGVGIPDNVRGHVKNANKSGAESMQWAFRRGNSTKKTEGIARGLGLDILREFVKVNNGTLEIFSHDGQAVIDKAQHFTSRSAIFPGTLVNITFSCDESYYRFASETTGKPLFS
ncbi:MAG TPA: ATP-binding protein [Candidatus Angelobacter sp.]|nr:ATP-binding protein [Candidatus Angelobacter sp.]